MKLNADQQRQTEYITVSVVITINTPELIILKPLSLFN